MIHLSWVSLHSMAHGFIELDKPVVCVGFPCGSAGKESACNVEDLDLIPGLGRSLAEGKGYPLQYSGLENFMTCIVHGTAESPCDQLD